MRVKLLDIRKFTWQQVLPYTFVVFGIIGLLASLMLTYDKIQTLSNPNYIPSCSINPVLSCGSVMTTPQAELLGMPNTIFGIIGFGALILTGVILLAGVQLKRWMWLSILAVATLGVIFMHYLFIQSVWVIGAICPWCFLVWMITIPIFWGVTVYNIRAGNIKLPGLVIKFIDKHNGDILGMWYLAILVILLVKFWYYWETIL